MKIAEVSKKYGITPDTLRYYERIGLLPLINRKKNGIRDYTEENCNTVGFVKCMRSAGIEVEALIEYMTLFQQGKHTADARKQILVEQRDKLQERMIEEQKTLDRLNYKINNYEKVVVGTQAKAGE